MDYERRIARHLKAENRTWGTRRIAGVLAKLGLQASRTSVQRMLRRRPRKPAKTQILKPLTTARPIKPRAPGHVFYTDFTLRLEASYLGGHRSLPVYHLRRVA